MTVTQCWSEEVVEGRAVAGQKLGHEVGDLGELSGEAERRGAAGRLGARELSIAGAPLVDVSSGVESAPGVNRFQMVADPRLQPLAPTAPERHTRIDDWRTLREAIEAAVL